MGSVCTGMCGFCYMWNLCRCSGLPDIYGQLEEGMGSVCHETYALQQSSRDLCLIRGVSLPKVSLHYAICET